MMGEKVEGWRESAREGKEKKNACIALPVPPPSPPLPTPGPRAETEHCTAPAAGTGHWRFAGGWARCRGRQRKCAGQGKKGVARQLGRRAGVVAPTPSRSAKAAQRLARQAGAAPSPWLLLITAGARAKEDEGLGARLPVFHCFGSRQQNAPPAAVARRDGGPPRLARGRRPAGAWQGAWNTQLRVPTHGGPTFPAAIRCSPSSDAGRDSTRRRRRRHGCLVVGRPGRRGRPPPPSTSPALAPGPRPGPGPGVPAGSRRGRLGGRRRGRRPAGRGKREMEMVEGKGWMGLRRDHATHTHALSVSLSLPAIRTLRTRTRTTPPPQPPARRPHHPLCACASRTASTPPRRRQVPSASSTWRSPSAPTAWPSCTASPFPGWRTTCPSWHLTWWR